MLFFFFLPSKFDRVDAILANETKSYQSPLGAT